MKHIRILLSSALLILISSCAKVPMASAVQDAKAKKFNSPPAGKSGLYIYRDTNFGAALTKAVSMDGRTIGSIAPKTYFYNVISPGSHKVSTQSEFGENSVELNAIAGSNHFIKQYIKMGVFVGGANLKLVSQEKGKKGVMKSKLAQ